MSETRLREACAEWVRIPTIRDELHDAVEDCLEDGWGPPEIRRVLEEATGQTWTRQRLYEYISEGRGEKALSKKRRHIREAPIA